MKLLLRRSIEHVGKIGDVVSVSDGYGRNYLLPQGHAVPVTPANKRQIEVEKVEYAKMEAERKDEMQRLARSIDGIDLQIIAKSQDDETLYGSVSAREIADKLKSTREIVVDPKMIKLAEPIKKLGAYEVEVKLHPEVSATLKLQVTRESEE